MNIDFTLVNIRVLVAKNYAVDKPKKTCFPKIELIENKKAPVIKLELVNLLALSLKIQLKLLESSKVKTSFNFCVFIRI